MDGDGAFVIVFCALAILGGLLWLWWAERSSGTLYNAGKGMAATIEDHEAPMEDPGMALAKQAVMTAIDDIDRRQAALARDKRIAESVERAEAAWERDKREAERAKLVGHDVLYDDERNRR